jgi:hypothetical protein
MDTDKDYLCPYLFYWQMFPGCRDAMEAWYNLAGDVQLMFEQRGGPMDLAKVYPYVVPAGYIEHAPDGPDGLILPLGHDIFAMLVHDLDGVCRNVLPEELADAGLTVAGIHGQALENLESLAQGQEIQKSMHQGPGGTPFMLWSGHWLTASCIRLPGLCAFATKYLKVDTVAVSVPQREAMLLFPLGTRKEREQMRALIRKNEEDARKLVTWEFFELSPDGLRPLVE